MTPSVTFPDFLIPTELLLIPGRDFLFCSGTCYATLKMRRQTARTEFQRLQLCLWESIPKYEPRNLRPEPGSIPNSGGRPGKGAPRVGSPRAFSEGAPHPPTSQHLAHRALNIILLQKKIGALCKLQLLVFFIFYFVRFFISLFLPPIETNLGEPPLRFRWNKVVMIKRV